MRAHGFGRSVVFAALAAALYPAFVLLAGPLLGPARALPVWIVGSVAFYVAWLAPRRSHALVAGALAAVLGALVLALAQGPRDVAVGAALVLGVCRSGLLHQARPARAVALEAGLLLGGLSLARSVASPGLLGTAIGIWAFGLVQSAYFLVGGVRERSERAGDVDPFELAHTRALRLMEDEPR
jgi:hypothetical protein